MSRIPMCVLLAALLGLTTGAREADAGARRSRPVRSGQTTCWNATGQVISCTGTGQDGELRRGEPRAYQDGGDGTIRDKRTALTWEKLCDDGSIHDMQTTYTLPNAFAKIAALNTVPCFAGFCDWRMPNRFELETLLDLASFDPSVPALFDTGCTPGCTVLTCSCTTASDYWTSSTVAEFPELAWVVSFGESAATGGAKSSFFYLRAVRGGS